MNDEMLRELKKMNEFLEKIDWKLWNLHKKFYEDSKDVPTTATQKPAAPAQNVEPVVPPAKYPTIETWE